MMRIRMMRMRMGWLTCTSWCTYFNLSWSNETLDRCIHEIIDYALATVYWSSAPESDLAKQTS